MSEFQRHIHQPGLLNIFRQRYFPSGNPLFQSSAQRQSFAILHCPSLVKIRPRGIIWHSSCLRVFMDEIVQLLARRQLLEIIIHGTLPGGGGLYRPAAATCLWW